MMLLFFAPTAFAASAEVVLCLENNGQASLERAIGEDCSNFANEISGAKSVVTPQHCGECTDYALSGSVFHSKAASAENTNKKAQKLFITGQSQNSWPQLSVALSLAATPPPLRISSTLAQLRTVIILV